MTQFLLLAGVALTTGTVIFGITALLTRDDPGLQPVEPDGRVRPLPADRPLVEPDLTALRFDTGLRGYRMEQVDTALRRAAYDIGYKDELIRVLQAEVDALREGRAADAETLRRAREAALAPVGRGGGAPDQREAAGEAAAEPAAGTTVDESPTGEPSTDETPPPEPPSDESPSDELSSDEPSSDEPPSGESSAGERGSAGEARDEQAPGRR